MARAIINEIGNVYGRWTVVAASSKRVCRNIVWLCLCECGRESLVPGHNLRAGISNSCGCLQSEVASRTLRATATMHGHAGNKSSEYHSWQCMKARCTNPKNPEYHNYGGRGIRVCRSWMMSFKLFLRDMGLKPGVGYSIDRYPDNDGNYEKSNCRWATHSQQANNKKRK